MMEPVFVLLMVFSVNVSRGGGVAVLQQEFTSLRACEFARKELAKSHNGHEVVASSQGCYLKGDPP